MHKLDEDLIRVNKLLVDCLESQLKESEEKIKNLEWNVANWERKESLQASCCWENEKAAKEAEGKLKIAREALELIVKDYPDSFSMEERAKEALEKLSLLQNATFKT